MAADDLTAQMDVPADLPGEQPEPTPEVPFERPRLSGLQKAATLLVALGQERAGKVLQHLEPDDVEILMVEIAKTQNLPPEQIDWVMEEVVETAIARGYFREGGFSYARDLLESALGEDRAAEILGRLQAMIEVRPFRFLMRTPPEQIYNYIRREKPQTIALILAHLPESQSASVLSLLDPDMQPDIIRRIATMKRTSPELISAIEREVRTKMGTVAAQNTSAAGGVEAAAKMINQVDRQTERNVFSHLEDSDKDLAEKIRNLLFVFEDIITLGDRELQLVIREADQSDLALALRGAPNDLKEKILSNMSERGAETLREELELMPPKRRREVEEAQTNIVSIVRRLEESGEIVISRGGEEDELV